MKEADQVEKRGEEVWVVASETLDIGWSFLQGVGAPKEIHLAGPSPSPTDNTAQELFTRELEVLRTVDVWCTSCGGRCTNEMPSVRFRRMLVLCEEQRLPRVRDLRTQGRTLRALGGWN
jgi:hypothetical protein